MPIIMDQSKCICMDVLFEDCIVLPSVIMKEGSLLTRIITAFLSLLMFDSRSLWMSNGEVGRIFLNQATTKLASAPPESWECRVLGRQMTYFPFYTSCFTCYNEHMLLLQVETIKKEGGEGYENFRIGSWKRQLGGERDSLSKISSVGCTVSASFILLNEWTLESSPTYASDSERIC